MTAALLVDSDKPNLGQRQYFIIIIIDKMLYIFKGPYSEAHVVLFLAMHLWFVYEVTQGDQTPQLLCFPLTEQRKGHISRDGFYLDPSVQLS